MKNVIITSFMGIGNTINLISLAEAFKKKRKKVYFIVWNRVAAKVIEGNKFVDGVFLIPEEKSIIKNISFCINLRKKINPKETEFVITYPHGPRREKFISKFYGAKKTTIIDEKQGVHDVLNNLTAANPNPRYIRPRLFLTKEEEKFAQDFINGIPKKERKILIGVHPGCFSGTKEKRVSVDDFCQIISLLRRKNPSSSVLIFFGPSEIDLIEKFKDCLGSKRILYVTEKNIKNVAAIISKCNQFVSNDSGLMHISEGVGVKRIDALFVSTPIFRNAPLNNKHWCYSSPSDLINKIKETK
jgi:ADP-heptose:LPS heptosyltransferase